jgi:GAF domain-containing protein
MLAKIRQFLAPPQFPEDDDKARVANLLNTLLWMLLFLFVVLAVAVTFLTDDMVSTVSFSVVALVNTIPLFLLRRKHVEVASWFVVVVFFTATVAAVTLISGLTLGSATALMVLVVLAGLLLGRLPAAVFVVLSIVAISVVLQLQATGQIVPQESSIANTLSLAATFILLGIALNITLRDLHNASSRMHRSNQELMAIRESLEQTVAERTRDLELAAEVGRSMSQIRELDVLLQDAVNTIQKRFGLYYAQVYLTDRRQKTLSLKAGTGIVGRQLARRGHVLSVGTGSINGTAAAEKRTIVVSNTAASPLFKPNSLLPYTRSEMAVPLILADRVLGVLNLQSDVKEGLTTQNIFAFETLAGQLAVAIENANLFTEAQEARAQVEEYVGLVVREGWDSYQDGITQPELLGFTFEGDVLQRVTQPNAAPILSVNRLDIPIVIANELIGTIQLEAELGHVWTEEEKEMATAVARQVGQQAENLRLLAETYQYRTQAEQSARRLSGEAWRNFIEGRGESRRGFVYDLNEIRPLSAETLPALPPTEVIQQPLQVQNETIGQVIVVGAQNLGVEALVTAVSDQLSSHIENLRLARQTESALAQTGILYRIGHDLNSANNVEEILLAAVRPVMATGVAEATLMFVELDPDNQPETLELLADWQHEGHPSYQVGTRFPVKQFPFAGLFLRDINTPQLLSDVHSDSRVDEFTRQVMTHAGIRAIAVIPLAVAQQWVGVITCSWSAVHPFSQQEKEIYEALINMAAPAVQSQRLFMKTKSQADKERLINIVNQRIQGTFTVDSALQTAVKELGKALQTTAQVKLTTAAAKQETRNQESVAAD